MNMHAGGHTHTHTHTNIEEYAHTQTRMQSHTHMRTHTHAWTQTSYMQMHTVTTRQPHDRGVKREGPHSHRICINSFDGISMKKRNSGRTRDQQSDWQRNQFRDTDSEREREREKEEIPFNSLSMRCWRMWLWFDSQLAQVLSLCLLSDALVPAVWASCWKPGKGRWGGGGWTTEYINCWLCRSCNKGRLYNVWHT